MAQPYTIKSGDERNDVSPAAPRGYSKFDLSHRFLQTHRFGEIALSESFETVKGAKDSFRLQSDTSSYSLKAPLKTDMFQKHSNFFVPLQAIIKNNWELLVAQPNNGDDVPEDVDGFVSAENLNSFFDYIVGLLTSFEYDDFGEFLSIYLRNLLVCEMFFSQGSLCKQAYIDFCHCVTAYEWDNDEYKIRSFDAFLERFLSALAPRSEAASGMSSFIKYFTVQWYDEDKSVTDRYIVLPDSLLSEVPTQVYAGVNNSISFRHFLDLARQNLNFTISNISSSAVLFDGGLTQLGKEFFFGNFVNSEGEFTIEFSNRLYEGINFDKLSAYQLCCAHFFSLDHVDYIYSAELYRQLMYYYTTKFSQKMFFTWNGIDMQYDALSGAAISEAINDLVEYTGYGLHSFALDYFTSLFSFRHSLRYLDYFTGGRTRPLSVGSQVQGNPANINVPVVNNQVDAVDVVVAQNAARYLNFAQRVGRKISQWLDKMFPGGQPRPDMHDPQWLSTVGDPLNPEQVQNTGESQVSDANSITARFKNDSNRFMFTVQPDRPGYIICTTYYDIPRAYAFATHRENMHKDRYDRFNPFMQYNGSQAVTRQELGISGNAPFSYQGRYEEYKQNYDVAAGGFVEYLPGFAFIADVQSGIIMQNQLNPSYVRSWNVELDPFYLALTGYGLAAYFHFVVKNVNILQCERPMEYAPQLM